MTIRWVFDAARSSGKRSGGNAAEYSFEGRIDTLVREVVQNSLDARLEDGEPVTVRFRLVDLSGGDLEEFRDGAGWSSLEDNLRAVPEQRPAGRAIHNALDAMDESDQLRLLVVEDYATRGLEGNEYRGRKREERNSFCALVKDELYSDKAGDDAGGSFGLGKSVLWAYSSLKTVLFASIPVSHPKGKRGLRFIGRTALPYHETDEDGACDGDGWLGVGRDLDDLDRRAESVWGREATRTARKCLCHRTPGASGLSAVVVGFAEPGEPDRSSEAVAEAIVAAALESFWPSIVGKRLRIEVQREQNGEVLEEREVDPADHEGYKPAVELLQHFEAGKLKERERLEIGESAIRWVEIEVPERRADPSHPSFIGQIPVLVRLLEDDSAYDPISDRVFRYRKPGMVVRTGGGRNLSIAARPYVAIVPAGLACGDGLENERVERFLRSTEPPEHDCWTHNTRIVKQDYKAWGAKQMLDAFDAAVLSAIRKLVSLPEEKGGALPKHLLRHLRFGESGGGGSPRYLSVTRRKAWTEGGRWRFQVRCRRVRPDDQPWHVSVHLKYAVDGGNGEDVHAITQVAAEGASQSVTRGGVGILEFPADVKSARIEGLTDASELPAIGTRSAVQLRIDGANGGIADA